jgi:hypothetical protein
MSFSALVPGNVGGYIAAQRQRHRAWVLHHIPKTAGSSLADELAARIGPYRNLSVDYAADTDSTVDLMDQAVERFLTDDPASWRSASGHLLSHHVERIARARPDVGFLTFLRHPVARIISEYRYCRTDRHPPWQAFIARYPSIEDFVDDPREANKMSLYLFGRREITPAQAVVQLLNRYAFIGLQERYPLSFKLMSMMMWGGSQPSARTRVTPDSDGNAVEITPALQARIREKNPLDLAIYDAVFEIYGAIADEAWALPYD